MFRHRPRLFLAAGLAAALVAVAVGEPPAHLSASAGPPAAGEAAPLRVGDRLDPRRLHKVTRPGLYGMNQPPAGSRYGIVDGKLIRYDPEKVQLLSIIRQVSQILD